MSLAEVTSEPWVPVDTFGSRLALIRQHFGWNVLEAATACGINDQTWRNWESGTAPRGMDKVARTIAQATGVDYRWLLAGGPLRIMYFGVIQGDAPAQGELPFDRHLVSV